VILVFLGLGVVNLSCLQNSVLLKCPRGILLAPPSSSAISTNALLLKLLVNPSSKEGLECSTPFS
jgi:hypothetical protein